MEVEIISNIHKIVALVESESVEGAVYKVRYYEEGWSCTCPSNRKAGSRCKHIKRVQEEVE